MKSPAILFYTSDFLTGISGLTMEERGQYITLLCLQHQLGHLPKKIIDLNISNVSNDVLKKFTKDTHGNLYQKRMEQELNKRKQHSQKQRENVMHRWKKDVYDGNTMVLPLEKENIIYNNISNIGINNKYNNYGYYKRIKLKKEQYDKLVLEFGVKVIDNQILLLDEYIQSNDNKNKYSDFNLVLRKSIRDKWFNKINNPDWIEKDIKKEKATEQEQEEIRKEIEEIKNG